MWNGAVFIPLIDDTDTIDPGRPRARSSAATAWLMKNAVSRFAANSARQSSRVTRVDGIHVAGAAPPAMLTSPYSVPSVRRTWSSTVAMPSSVDASAATGTTARPSAASGATCSSRFSFDRLTATTVAPACAASRVTVVPIPPPPAPETTTMRPSSRSAIPVNATSLVRTNNAALHIEEHYSAALIPSSRTEVAPVRRYCLDYRRLLTSERMRNARYAAPNPSTAPGWRLDRVTAPSRLYGANGLRTGPDGRVYVAQVTGSRISALDLTTNVVDTVSAQGGDIIAPDDVAFGADGTLYATEVMDGRVSARDTAGRTRVLRDDLPCANGITVHQGRLFIGECRDGGRLMELPLDGGEPRILLDNLASPNAMEVGPDGLLYFPLMTANEIWRVDPDGGEPQRVAADLGVPDAVKFDSDGFLVSTQVASGQVLRIDPRTGDKTILAQLNPGLDNLTFVGERLFASNFTGEITEILSGGGTSTVLPGGLNWPLDLTVADGRLHVADGTYFYVVTSDGALQTVGMLFSPGTRASCAASPRSAPGSSS